MSTRLLSALLALPLVASGAEVDPDDPGILTTPVQADGAWRPTLRVDSVQDLDPDGVQLLLEDLASRAPVDALQVAPVVLTADGPVDLEALIPPPPPVPTKEVAFRGRPVDHVGKADGALSGKAVYLSQCHGFNYYESLNRWSTQRGNLFDTVEDFHNPEGMNQFLTAYLENAGANVFTAKERDHNPAWAIVDNADPGYSETGDGFRSGTPGYGHQDRWSYGEEVFRTGSTRTMPASGGGVATWTVDVPEDGTYAVYISWDAAANNASDAHYRITHPGGVIDRTFDQRVHGSTWQYVEQLPLRASEPLIIELIADSSDRDATLSMDAVRIGGGIGVIERYGDLTGRPRWEEAAIVGTQFNGAPASIYDPYNDRNDGSDPPARSRWADWEHPTGEDALYLSWHSNATANGSARGTVTYIYEGSAGPAVTGSSDLAWAVQQEMVDSFQTLWEPAWQDRGVKSAAFSEVNPGHNDEMPAALVELAFHDNETDVAYLKHPRFRLDASRAMYRGIVRYFAERDGQQAVYLPEPPIGLRTRHTRDGEVELSWQPGAVGAPFGDAPTDYLVQLSTDGRIWTEGFAVSGTSTILDLEPGAHSFARVVASNDGGLSFASEVVGAVRSPDGVPAVLIVDAFDRFEPGQLRWEDVTWTIGPVRRMEAWRINNHDIIAPHGEAVRRSGWPYDSISDERLPEVDLSAYRVVVWATGEESTVDETISTEQQGILRQYWQDGGALWVSGAEVLWDLDERGTATDQAFATEVLGAGMANDDAGTYEVVGEGPLAGLRWSFAPEAAPYDVEWPDVLDSDRPILATYAGGGVAGILGERVAVMGFPFEAINGPDMRADVAQNVLAALASDYVPPDIDDEPPDTDVPTDPAGPSADDRVRIADRGGCGCAMGGPATGWLWLAPVWLWAARRRRERSKVL